MFFKLGPPGDTVADGERFFLFVPHALKSRCRIHTQNAMLLPVSDSVVTLRHVPGLRYEGVYEPLPKSGSNTGWRLIAAPNGATQLPPAQVRVSIIPGSSEGIELENLYWMRP